MYSNLQPVVVQDMKYWLSSHSHGRLTFTDDTGIVEVPGFGFADGDPSTALSWSADLQSDYYQIIDSGPDSLVQDYRSRWGSGEGTSPEIADLTSWRGSYTEGSLSYLFSEILYKIFNAYALSGVPQAEWPFGVSDGSNDENEVVDLVFFIFMAKKSIWGDKGGTIGVNVVPENVEAFSPLAEDFFGNIKPGDHQGPVYQGTQQMQNSSSYRRMEVGFDVERCSMVILHEFTHTLGFLDGPPNLQSYNPYTHPEKEPGRYYYGNMNITCQKFYPGHGVPVLSLSNLEKTNWLDVVDFTGENLTDVVLYDLRNPGDDSGNNAGKIYKFRLENPSGLSQYFLFGYHASQGIDGFIWPNASGPALVSNGLEVQHIVGNIDSPAVVDVESAFGLFENILTDEMPDINLPSEVPLSWGTPLTTPNHVGYDNHDYWWVQDDPNQYRALRGDDHGWGDYTTYTGDIFDFFTSDTLTVGNATWTSNEFSYSSNPNCYWYSNGPYSSYAMRRNPQNVSNSLMVRIKEQHNNPANGPPYMVVDFISAPFGELLDPHQDPPGVLPVFIFDQDQITIRWTTEFANAIDRVDVLFSQNNGLSYLKTIADNVAVSPGDTVLTWTPGIDDGTPSGVLKVIYKNPYSSHTSESISEAFFVGAPFNPVEDFLYPENGEVFQEGDTITLEWTNFWKDQIDSVSLSYSTDDGITWNLLQSGIGPDDNNDLVQQEVTLTADMVSAFGRFKLVFSQDGTILSEDVSAESILVMPENKYHFTDVTSDSHLEYDGIVYSFNSLDLDPGQWGNAANPGDLFISFEDANVAAKLFKNNSQIGYILLDEILSSDIFSNLPPRTTTTGSVSGDLNNDGYDDLICASPTDPAVYLYEPSTHKFRNILSDTLFFDSSAAALFGNSYTASLIDYNRDGRLDIYIGRAQRRGTSFTPLTDALFEQQADSTFVDITADIGLDDENGATLSAVWCDFDQDNLWELVIGEADSGPSVVFDQDENGSLVPRTNPFPADFSDGYVDALQWTDMDRDGDFDLLVTRSLGNSYLLLNDSGVFTSSVVFSNEKERRHGNGMAVDFDSDGWPDLFQGVDVQGGGGINGTPLVPQARVIKSLAGENGFSFGDFAELADAAGLAQINANAPALLFDDLDGDGAMDALIGGPKTSDQNVIFHGGSISQGGSDNRWLGVKLESSTDNTSSFGAVVVVKKLNGEIIGMQTADGGSARGSQQPGVMHFGLGDVFETIVVEVTWPANPMLAQHEEITAVEENFNKVITIVQGTDLDIFESSISIKIDVVPSTSLLDRTFTWRTNRLTSAREDRVFITTSSGTDTLTTGDPDVLVLGPEYKIDGPTGEAYFEHELIWQNQPCVVNSSFTYKVGSCIESNCEQGAPAHPLVKTKICLSGQ